MHFLLKQRPVAVHAQKTGKFGRFSCGQVSGYPQARNVSKQTQNPAPLFYPKTVRRSYKVYAPAYASRKRLILIQIADLSTETCLR
ncbi:hypothetical protein H3H36_05560 [Duganella sp. FT3S]|uniref:Uncharacterized protein n=1 Tax=Rugamonas fusca TaxID=2758568 RepID=A0A7W2EFE1_9BURK|nr:hypothetical protein [Rugamonas fusca]MBA5604827.1 hypothetical protein [Rugamonas fusca]